MRNPGFEALDPVEKVEEHLDFFSLCFLALPDIEDDDFDLDDERLRD